MMNRVDNLPKQYRTVRNDYNMVSLYDFDCFCEGQTKQKEGEIISVKINK
jgi:hypothetical protein